MNASDLAKILKANYNSPPSGKKTVEIHLFGIRHANALKVISIDEVVALAGISKNYATEIRKGIALADFVKPI